MKTLELIAVIILLGCGEVAQADPLENWTWRNPLPTGADLIAVAYGDGGYLALGSDGSAVTSTNGVTWDRGDRAGVSSDFDVFCGLACGKGQFVAVAWDYVAQALAIDSSADGLNWVQRLVGPLYDTLGADKYSIAYGNGLFVVVPGDASRDFGAVSPDGINWNLVQAGVPDAWIEAITYGQGQFVAVGYYGSIITSSNGVDWVRRQSGTANYLLSVAYGDGEFVAVGLDVTNDGAAMVTSPDGVNWSPRPMTNSPGPLEHIAYLDGKFLVPPGDPLMTSTDGVNWVQSQSFTGIGPLSVASSNGQSVGVSGVGEIWTSSDGLSWERREPHGPRNDLQGIAYGNGLFVTVGLATNASSPPALLTSPDAVSWTQQQPGTRSNLQAVAYGNGRFVAVGDGGASVASPDGTNWVQEQTGTANNLQAISYASGRFVAVGERGTIIDSADGINWLQRSSGTRSALSAIAYGNGQSIAVGDAGAIVASVDGTNWSQRPFPTPATALCGIAFGNGRFIISGQTTNVGGIAMTSTDGVRWDRLNSGGLNGVGLGLFLLPYCNITFANGQFVAVNGDSDLSTSADALNWTGRNLPGPVSAVTFGNGHFVAVGPSGTILESASFVSLALAPNPGTGQLTLSLTGPTGLAYTVQSSSDLISWQTVTNITPVQPTTVILRPLPSLADHAFYRAYAVGP